MLAKRIIPCLDVKDGRVVKGVNFLGLRDAGDPVEIAQRYDDEGADELTFLDITASHERRRILLDVVARTAETVFMPLTVGGGVRELQDMRDLLNAGADKVSINTAAVQNPELVRAACERFGSQCVVVAIDAKRVGGAAADPRPSPIADRLSPERRGGGDDRRYAMRDERLSPIADRLSPEGRGEDHRPYAISDQQTPATQWQVFTHGGRTPTGLDAVEWARRMEAAGAGEILLTSMDRDGTKEGYDIALTRAIVDAVRVPVIASGGVGTLEHIYDGLTAGGASAALAASIFHYREYTVQQCKDFLAARGVAVR